MTRPVLAIVAFRLQQPADLEALLPCLLSLRRSDAQVLVIEDAAPGGGSLAEAAAEELECAYVAQDDGGGLVAAANAGLELALHSGFDALLVGPDVELLGSGWLERLQARRDTAGRPAAVAGGWLHYADGLVEHAGFFYSVLQRRWLSRFAGVPAEVAEAAAPTLCPVSARLQLIRCETLDAVGLMDPQLPAPYAGLDLCLRVFDAGLECVYEPGAAGRSPHDAPHGRLEEDAAAAQARARFESLHAPATFNRFIPDVI